MRPGPIRRAPFPRGLFGEAPQHEIAARDPLGRLLGDHGQGETERRRAVAIGFGPDAMKPAALQLVQKPGWGWEIGRDGWKEEGRRRGGAAPGAGGMARDTGTCSSTRICSRRCSIRTLALAPPAFPTPAGGTRRLLSPPGTSLRTLLTSTLVPILF